jgi:hypothetical protein
MRPSRTPAARRCLAVLLALAAAAPAHAQLYRPPPFSTLFDTSVRSAAMGGAGAAVTWGEPGVWANPATLAGVNGMGWVTNHFHTLPGIADELVFSSQRVLIGGGGIGFSVMGQPISGLGKSQFDFGPIALPLGGEGPTPYDRTEGWGVGISPLKVIESLRRLGKLGPAGLTSYGDIALGYQNKVSKGVIPEVFTFDEASTYDWGATGRLALARWWGADAQYRFDLSGGYSQVNVLKSSQPSTNTTTQQIDRFGGALHLSPAPPSARTASPPSLPWWRPGDVPELSVSLAYDREHHHNEPFSGQDFSVDHYGFEANVFRLLALRVGYVSDQEGEIEGWTYGGGVSLPIGPWGSVGWQLASVPLAPDLDRQFRQGWSVWLHPESFFPSRQ